MKFLINATKEPVKAIIYYVTENYSFVSEPGTKVVDYSILINDLELVVVDHSVVRIIGLCPHNGWLPTNLSPKGYIAGALELVTNKKPGFTYRFNDDKRWSTYVNRKEGWVCIGDPKKGGTAVEFISNCIAVVDDNALVALWLKPQSLPPLDRSNPAGLRLIKR